jgi:putative acetyltransferase
MKALSEVRELNIRELNTLIIREELPSDRTAVREVNRLAFAGDEEADLVDRLRRGRDIIVSLVAVDGRDLVGHILFSELPIETGERTIRGAALAPLAVRPDRQRQGIGSALVRKGLAICRQRGVQAVVVLGHADYYPRFGFSPAKARRLRAPFSGDAFMALEITPGVLAVAAARVRYPSAFGLNDR